MLGTKWGLNSKVKNVLIASVISFLTTAPRLSKFFMRNMRKGDISKNKLVLIGLIFFNFAWGGGGEQCPIKGQYNSSLNISTNLLTIFQLHLFNLTLIGLKYIVGY